MALPRYGQSSRVGRSREPLRLAHCLVKSVWCHVVAVRPSGSTPLDEHPPEKLQVLERFDHRAGLRDDLGKIPLTLRPIREPKPEDESILRPQFNDAWKHQAQVSSRKAGW